ncbi:DUF1264-domain-containing protein [Aulographum hederae CBS 113979]|uniref:DUF1264-domain-containing protein n=1 Tax=Aulographum hederae CBS 113979 TaxID=1176131 RepID=A0A6G1GRJ6_9PEZI|nr:DUF1264-domain-containing protein [Aulographum hederae CBS 113979]
MQESIGRHLPDAAAAKALKPIIASANPLLEEFGPFHSICEFLTAIHIYADEAKEGKVRYVEATHFCGHVKDDLRQCLIYDSPSPTARLIGVEYMVPRSTYERFPDAEKKLWHSHEFEVKSGMLVLPRPSFKSEAEWEAFELDAMKEVVGLYGKTWHFWEVDRGDEYPFGHPKLMGSLINDDKINLDEALKNRNETFNVDHKDKAKKRAEIEVPDIHPMANSWWKV